MPDGSITRALKGRCVARIWRLKEERKPPGSSAMKPTRSPEELPAQGRNMNGMHRGVFVLLTDRILVCLLEADEDI